MPLGSIIGGLFGRESAKDQRAHSEAMNAQNIQLQREFAQQGIRWRVEDAKAAGLHPLFALGGGGAAYSPAPISMPGAEASYRSGQQFGAALSEGLQMLFTYMQSQQKKDEALAAAAHANAALARNAALSSQDFAAGGDPALGGATVFKVSNPYNELHAIDFSPQKVLSRRGDRGDLTPYVGPGGTVHQLAPGFRMILPSSEEAGAAQGLESIGEDWDTALAYIRINAEAFGDEWLEKAKRYFPVKGRIFAAIRTLENAYSWAQEGARRIAGGVDWLEDRLGEEQRFRKWSKARGWDEHLSDVQVNIPYNKRPWNRR